MNVPGLQATRNRPQQRPFHDLLHDISTIVVQYHFATPILISLALYLQQFFHRHIGFAHKGRAKNA